MTDWTNERTNDWTSERMNEWTCDNVIDEDRPIWLFELKSKIYLKVLLIFNLVIFYQICQTTTYLVSKTQHTCTGTNIHNQNKNMNILQTNK